VAAGGVEPVSQLQSPAEVSEMLRLQWIKLGTGKHMKLTAIHGGVGFEHTVTSNLRNRQRVSSQIMMGIVLSENT
jgi:hypothetical protein